MDAKQPSLMECIFQGLPQPVFVVRGKCIEFHNTAARSMNLGAMVGKELTDFVSLAHRPGLEDFLSSQLPATIEVGLRCSPTEAGGKWLLQSGPLPGYAPLRVILAMPVASLDENVDALHGVLTQAGCVLWHARVTLVGERFVWDLNLLNEEVVRTLLPLDLMPGEKFQHAWYRSRDPEDSRQCDERSEDALRRGVQRYSQEFRCRDREGNWKWFTEDVDLRGNLQDGFVVTGVCMDITDRVKIGLELEAALQEARMASRAKGDFLASMSHEIRTPMNAVIGMTDLLRQTELSIDQAEMVETAHDAGRSLLGILDEILDMTKIEAGKLELHEELFDLRELVEKVVGLFAAVGHARGIDLLWRWEPGTPKMVRGDGGRIRQILSNIVGNASKFTEHGFVSVRVHSRDATDPERRGFIVEISDTGPGITQEGMMRLFHPFVQSGARSSRQGGTGLGLAISRRLAQAMGGDILVQSVLGKGSIFQVELELPFECEPLVSEPGLCAMVLSPSREVTQSLIEACDCLGVAAVPYSRATPNGVRVDFVLGDLQCQLELSRIKATWPRAKVVGIVRGVGGVHGRHLLHLPVRLSSLARHLGLEDDSSQDGNMRQNPAILQEGLLVLVADDNPVNRRVIERQLQSMGVHPVVVDGGEAAFQKLSSIHFDIAFLDMQMPDLDGHMVAQRIRVMEREKKGRRVPLVALSASVLPEDREACLGAGMDEFLAKPASRQDLAGAIHRFTGYDV